MKQYKIGTCPTRGKYLRCLSPRKNVRVEPHSQLLFASLFSTLRGMFYKAKHFDQDLSLWNVSKAVDLGQMFFFATSFQGKNLGAWDTSRVTSLNYTFAGASSFAADVGLWDVSKVQHFESTFRAATAFNADLSEWRLDSATNMESAFEGASMFQQDLCSWGQYENETNDIDWTNAFLNSGCPVQLDPMPPSGNISTWGPFCYPCMP